MNEDGQRAPQTPAARLAAKLQAFFDTLPNEEKQIMARLVRLAAEHVDVEGYAADDPDHGPGAPSSEVATPRPPRSPIDDFRVNLGLYLGPEV